MPQLVNLTVVPALFHQVGFYVYQSKCGEQMLHVILMSLAF